MSLESPGAGAGSRGAGDRAEEEEGWEGCGWGPPAWSRPRGSRAGRQGGGGEQSGSEAARAAEREPAVARHESPEEPGRQRVWELARRVEGGMPQENCEKRRWESPRMTGGSVIPAFLTCVLTACCTDANQNLHVGKAELFPE